MIAVVGQPGAWSTERLASALRTAGAETLVVDLAACALRLPEPGVWHAGRRLEVEAAVVKKIGDTADGWAVRERLQILRHLEASGVPVWSAPDRLEVAVDRYRMTVELVRAGLPVPQTVVTEDVGEATAAVERFGAAVLKPLFTSKGRGMLRLDPALDLSRIFARHRLDGAGPLYLQRFVKHPGRDLGVAVLDGRCLGAYWRIAGDGQWMTTVLSGGRYEPADPPAAALALAERAARHFGLLFTGVDLIEGDDGFTVLEVSAFGGFRGLLEGCGVDAAPRPAALAHALPLRIADVPIRVTTNDLEVWTRLRLYYNPWVVGAVGEDGATVRLVHDGSVTPPDGFADIARADGKKVKEAVRDASGERLVLKRTTGVLMGLRPGAAWARGDLRANLNQAINLVNHCYAAAVLARGHLLLHAAAVSWNGRAAALAGPPGAGKSTAALHLVEAGYRFASNDRLLVQPRGDGVEALGYPKQPRVNPGTLLSHSRLRRRVPPDERRALEALPPADLWDLERKSDVDLEAIYGKGTIELRGDLRALVLLRWRRDGAGLDARRLSVEQALAAVPLIHKDLGVFDVRRPLGTPAPPPDLARYAELFARIAVIEVRGRAQPSALADVVGDHVAR